MKLNIKTSALNIIFCAILLSCPPSNKVNAQDVAEPPIPVYIVCPYHEDSLRMAYQNSLSANSSASSAAQKYDTLQLQVQKSAAENTAHFTWLYALIALLGTMNIVLLFSVSRIRKELAQMKRFEHHQKLAASDLMADLERSSESNKSQTNRPRS